jgi:DNA-binding NarL/FixJ family response regulator
MVAKLHKRLPDKPIVVLTADDSPMFAYRMLNAGALGYVLKELAERELPAAIRAAAGGDRARAFTASSGSEHGPELVSYALGRGLSECDLHRPARYHDACYTQAHNGHLGIG